MSPIIKLCRDHLADIVGVETYEYASCYLWYDRPLFDSFGEQIRQLPGDTIYLCRHTPTPAEDLFHELGHVVGRKFDLVGHAQNGFRGCWERRNKRLIWQVSAKRHWSQYLNRFAQERDNFQFNAASEIWAELFMLWHLYPYSDEARLLDEQMSLLEQRPSCIAIGKLALKLLDQGLAAGDSRASGC